MPCSLPISLRSLSFTHCWLGAEGQTRRQPATTTTTGRGLATEGMLGEGCWGQGVPWGRAPLGCCFWGVLAEGRIRKCRSRSVELTAAVAGSWYLLPDAWHKLSWHGGQPHKPGARMGVL